MIKGLPKVVIPTMFVVFAVLVLCAASASARPHGIGITGGGCKGCASPPKHSHHQHRKCWKYLGNGKWKRVKCGHKPKVHCCCEECHVSVHNENPSASTPEIEVEIPPIPEKECVIEQTLPPVVLGGNCEGFDGGPSCQYIPQGCNEVIPVEINPEPRNPCAEKICEPQEPPEEECPEKQEEIPGPKG